MGGGAGGSYEEKHSGGGISNGTGLITRMSYSAIPSEILVGVRENMWGGGASAKKKYACEGQKIKMIFFIKISKNV